MCDVKQENGNFYQNIVLKKKKRKKYIVACIGVKKIKEDLSIVEQSSLLYKTLNLSGCAASSTDTKSPRETKKVICHLPCLTCHISGFTWVYTITQLQKCATTQVQKIHKSKKVHNHKIIKVHNYASTQSHNHTGTHVHKYTISLVHKYTTLQVNR